jgi:hypothetical protein
MPDPSRSEKATVMPEYREPPAVTPRPFGLFSVESPTLKSDGPWATGAEWESIACATTLNYANALCSFVGTNEGQTVTITGTPTGGTFRLTFFGQQTGTIAYNANAATVQTALLALSNLDTGDVTVTGGPGPGTPYVVTFGGQWASEDVPQMTASHAFTGGTAPNIAVTTTTAGVRTAKARTSAGGSVTADPFSVYVLRECRTVGEMQRAQDRAMQVLNLNEEAAVEQELWTRLSVPATNITPGTAPSPEVGLAMLEEAIAANYAGRPIIHASVNLASYLTTKGAAERHGTHLETGIGSPLVSGRGYPRSGPGGAPAAGTEWLIASGGIFIERGNAFVSGPHVQESPRDNTQIVLAERTYVTGFDCTPVAIRVTFP